MVDCRVPFTFALTVLTVALALVPAVIIWAVFLDLMTGSVDLLRASSRDSTSYMAEGMQTLMINLTSEILNTHLVEGENELAVQSAMIQASGFLGHDLHPSRFDLLGQILIPYHTRNFATVKNHQYFSAMGIIGASWKSGSDSDAVLRLFWIQWIALYFDVLRSTVGSRTMYHSDLCLRPNEQLADYNVSYSDQMIGRQLVLLQTATRSASDFVGVYSPSGWDTDLSFNLYTGQIEFSLWQWMPALNDTWIQASISISAQGISDELRGQLDGYPDDRLAIFFRQPHGHMIAASHGKFFSHSDVDFRYINPLDHPPNISAYRLWTCLESNDALIPLACQQLYSSYQSWTVIPDDITEMVLAGQRYWVATAHTMTSLQATVLMLKNRAAAMGEVDRSSSEVDHQVEDKKGVTFIILGVVTGVAVVLPLGLGLWLAARLLKLAAGIDQIAKLQFSAGPVPPTVFSEVHRFQSSVVQMERGLQAFEKFVPQAVVKVLIAGDMASNDRMGNETLTIMFADIEGFSTVCETVAPEVLVEVCTEYFEATCTSIVQAHGTIDKFIGDCIMAMWNAPQRRPGHERDAVAAALAMQDVVLKLHDGWEQRGLPILKFRLGINTGVCLVGNFGCSYRVSYTCLGDGVNLAARLEALNKKFGTYMCVSHATYEGCQDDFHFRRLAKVTVPGKAEVLPVYEVLCPRRAAEPPTSPASSGSPRGLLADRVPYRWQHVDQAVLLAQADQYETAYEALALGDLEEARRLLAAADSLPIPDKAWRILENQLEQTTAAGSWDGVFYFREK
eukprot:EG_transcript_1202